MTTISAIESKGHDNSLTQRASAERSGSTKHALGKIAKNDFSINKSSKSSPFITSQSRRNTRYQLRNNARDLARSIPAKRAQKRAVERYEHILQAEKHRAERKGRLFDLSSVKEKIPSFRSHRMTYCGSSLQSTNEPVIIRQNHESAGITNLQSCGSYACPVCAPKIGNRRFEEVTQVLQAAKNKGYYVAMITLTVRHDAMDKLDDSWDALNAGWRAITTDKKWSGETIEAHLKAQKSFLERGEAYEDFQARKIAFKASNPKDSFPEKTVRAPRGWAKSKTFRDRQIGLKEEFGIIGTIRSTEVTYGKNGWHPHVHALVIFKAGDLEEATLFANEFGHFMHKKWEKGIKTFGFTSLKKSGGLDISLMGSSAKDIARYATKISSTSGIDADTKKMGFESTRGDLKTARKGGFTPMELLEKAVEGEADAISAWKEFAVSSQGRRWVVISPELRKLGDLEDEKTDEEIADETVEATPVAAISYEEWKSNRVWLFASDLLTILEDQGSEALFKELDKRGIPYDDLSDFSPDDRRSF